MLYPKTALLLIEGGLKTVERKTKVQLPPDGKLVDGYDVPVLESTERWTEIKLEDGSVLRLKPSIVSAVRLPEQWDPHGNPMYALMTTNTMVVADAPAHLKRPQAEANKKLQ
jgi:hypothetical protein